MAKLTEEQKEQFLDLTRRGWNRGAAAREVGSTGTQIGRMVDEGCHSYDHEFALLYHEAVADSEDDGTAPAPRESEWAPVRETTTQGFIRWMHIDAERKQAFLELVETGVPRDLAARRVGTSLGQFEKLARNDEEFAASLKEAYETGYPHYKEWLNGKAHEEIESGNWNALRDALIVHDERWRAALKTSRTEVGGIGGGSIKMLVETVIPELPLPMIDLLIERIESGQDLSDVIDQIPRKPDQAQLPPAAAA